MPHQQCQHTYEQIAIGLLHFRNSEKIHIFDPSFCTYNYEIHIPIFYIDPNLHGNNAHGLVAG